MKPIFYKNWSIEKLERELKRLEREIARIKVVLRNRKLGGGRNDR